MKLTVRVEPTVAGLAGWDGLVIGEGGYLPSHDPYLSTSFLRLVGLFGRAGSQYLAAFTGERLVGGATAQRVDEHVADRTARLDGLLPGTEGAALAVGGLYDDRTGVLTEPALSDQGRAAVICQLFGEAEEIARRDGEGFVVCRCVDSGDLLLRGVLRDRGYSEVPGLDHFVLVLPPGGLDGYVSSFASRYRNKVRREVRILREAGVVLSVEPMTQELIAEAVPLVVNLHDRYGVVEDPDFVAARMRVHCRAFKGSVYGVVARTGGRAVGFMELVVHRGNGWARHAGFDYQAQGRLPVYFGVMFYAVMDFAAERGLGVLDYSWGSDGAKRERGCQVRPTVRLFKVLST